VRIEQLSDHHRDAAVEILSRFFREEGFATSWDRIAQNLAQMCADSSCWVAVAVEHGQLAGIVTVTTMLYVEWGRLGEIGDLYVLPEQRGRRLGKQLVHAAIAWCHGAGCSGVYVTVTPQGEARHRLSQFYERLDFHPTGRTTMTMSLLTP
jgi:GNAT superfamily N-acetyltransferase